MAEPVKEWRMDEDYGHTEAELYENVTDEDRVELRNKAAKWSFGRELTEIEHTVISNSLIKLTSPITMQYYPRIELRRARSGLTLEVFGFGTRRVGIVSYYAGEITDPLVILEKVTTQARRMERQFSSN